MGHELMDHTPSFIHAQSVEELAMGDEGWQYKRPFDSHAQDGEEKEKGTNVLVPGGVDFDKDIKVSELRAAISQLARREDRCDILRPSLRTQVNYQHTYIYMEWRVMMRESVGANLSYACCAGPRQLHLP